MSRKPTPSPKSRWFGTGLVVLVVIAGICGLFYLAFGSLLAFIPAVCLWALYVYDKAYGMIILALASIRWQRQGKHGLLIYSESPHWHEYIEREWFPLMADRMVRLNYSERNGWQRTLPVRVFEYFVEWGGCIARRDDYYDNKNPAVLLLRGMRYPYVYRFFYAFRDAKHGNLAVLEALEGQLFEALGITKRPVKYIPMPRDERNVS